MARHDDTVRKCKQYRDRHYPPPQRPGVIYRDAALAVAGDNLCIADIGCGRNAKWLKGVSEHFGRCIGLDLEVENTRLDDKVELIRVDVSHIPLPDESVDVVVSQDVFEHIEDPLAVLRECRRILKPGGHVIILTPNMWYPPLAAARLLPHRVRQILNRVATGTASYDTFPTYYRANTARKISKLMLDANLEPVEVRYLGSHPLYFMFSTLFYRVAVFFDKLIFQREALRGLRHDLFCHARKPAETAAA